MTSRRCCGAIVSHAPISSRVRPQPKQNPVFVSIEQTRMQGDSIAVIGDPRFLHSTWAGIVANASPSIVPDDASG